MAQRTWCTTARKMLRARPHNGSQAFCPANPGSATWCLMYVDFRQLLPNLKADESMRLQFRQLEPSELPPGISSGISYTSVCINTPQYLHYLLRKCLSAGVVVKREILTNISEARTLHSSGRKISIVINCTGLGAATLGGVRDPTVYPARGHVVLLRNDAGGRITFVSGTDDGPDETTYIMQRPGGGGTVVGGCYQAGKTEAEPDPAMGERILERAVKLVPSLGDGKGRVGLDVIRHGVGLRPVREGGYRVEREALQDWSVVHNYGHGGAGYQCSYGCAEEAVRLVKEAVRGSKL
jgi:D-amino-acid oxidase